VYDIRFVIDTDESNFRIVIRRDCRHMRQLSA
jgi:hypothetical protein